MLNKVILIGRLGKDPEVKYSASGTPVAKMTLATSERVKDGDSWVDHTEWHTLTAFGKTAEFVQQYVGKGRLVYVEGKIRTRSWEDQSGIKRYATEILVDALKALGPPPNKDAANGNAEAEPPAADADVPF